MIQPSSNTSLEKGPLEYCNWACASSGSICPPCGNSNFPVSVMAVVTEQSTTHGLHSHPHTIVCIDVRLSWKVEKTSYPIVELHHPAALNLASDYVAMWVFPNM